MDLFSRIYSSSSTAESLEILSRRGMVPLFVGNKPIEDAGREVQKVNTFRKEEGLPPCQPKNVMFMYCTPKAEDAAKTEEWIWTANRDVTVHYGFADASNFKGVKGYEAYAAREATATAVLASSVTGDTKPAASKTPGYHASNLLIGTPEEIFNRINAAQEACSFCELTIVPQFGTMPYDEAMASTELFAKEVLPAVQTWRRRCTRQRSRRTPWHDWNFWPRLRSDRDAGRHRPSRAARKVSSGARKAAATRRIQAVHRTRRRLRGLLRNRSALAASGPRPDRRGHRRSRARRRIRRSALGAYLKKAGVEDVRIIELGGDFGGVWYWNRYPGLQCDNESYCYIPLLEELEFHAVEEVRRRHRNLSALPQIGKHFGLYDSAMFSTQVRDTALGRGDQALADQHRPRRRHPRPLRGDGLRPLPPPEAARDSAGIKDFKGHSFHPSRWDYAYTGGDSNGGLDKLADKRVAVVGTGATAMQIVPFLGRDAKHLYVFQRTPSSVGPRNNVPTDPEWVKSLQPGWQKERQRNFHAWTFEGMALGQPDYVCDFWTELGRNTAARVMALEDPASMTPEQFMDIREEEDYKVMERLRRRVGSIVDDPVTAEALKPYYRFLCKRPCTNDEYLQTFNRPNVTLVDVSSTKGVERATENGLVANGVEYEVDCIIYASGFEITTEISRRYSIDAIEGRDGLSLFDYWRNGYRTLHGFTSRGFPNQFFTGFTQVGISANIAANYELQGEHIAYIIAEALSRGVTTVEPTQEAQDEWCTTIRDTAIDNTQFDLECTPGYYNNEGGGAGAAEGEGIRSHIGEPYGPGFYAFGDLLAAWRDKGDMDGLVLGS